MKSITSSSASDLARAIRSKQLSALEVVDAHLERIAEVNPRLNAVVALAAERARGEAKDADAALARGEVKGPLHGVPVTIKVNLDTAGIVSTGGTRGRAAFVPTSDAVVVSRLRAAGAIVLGKTNTPELTLSFETDNLVYGKTNNPYDLARSPGGSSGGAAAIIAACGSPLDLGSDTGGSIRVPSHMCGTAGIKPTSGRVPRTGHIIPAGGALDAFTQIGPMARRVADLVLTLPIISGVDWRDAAIMPVPLGDPSTVDLKTLRVAFHSDNGLCTPTADIVATVNAAASALSDAGAQVWAERPAGIEQTAELIDALFDAESGEPIAALLQSYGTSEPHPGIAHMIDHARAHAISASAYLELLHRWEQFRCTMLMFMEQCDVILCPACATTAPRRGGPAVPDRGYTYTETYNLTGWPGVVVRCGVSAEGLPIGVQIVARPWHEHVALAVAQYLEGAFGGWQPPP